MQAEALPPISPWRDAFDHHGQGLWEWDLRSDRVWSSHETLRLLGLAATAPDTEDLARWLGRVHPDDSAAARAALDAHLSGAQPGYYSEHRLRRADGHYHWFATRGRIVARDAQGRPLRMLGTQTDVHHQKLAELALRDGESIFRRIFDDAPIGLSLLSLKGRWLEVNAALCELLGYSERELLQLRFSDLTHADDRADDALGRQQLLDGVLQRLRLNKRYIARGGEAIPVQVDVSLVRDADGQPQYFVSQVQDRREWQRYEEQLHDEKELAQVTLAAIADAVIRTGRDDRIEFCNSAALQLLGCERAGDVLGRAFGDVVSLSGDGAQPLPPPAQGHADWPPIAQLTNQRGELLPVEISLAPVAARDGEPLGSVCVLHDVSHTRRLSEQLIYQASHDALTGLPNRREFEAELAHWLSTARLGNDVHTLLYLDLDHFRLINETAGHNAGDRLVCDLAPRLRDALPPSALLARTGGDEFAVLLPCAAPPQARRVGEDLLHVIEAFRFEHDGRAYKIAASIGISALDAATRDANSALAEADTACYIAKRQGGHRIQFYHSGDDTVRQAFLDIDWASRIQHALESDGVELHAQRIVSLRAGGQVSYEVLLRIRHDDGSLQRPGAFLSAADRYGLSGHVDRWVVEHSLEQLGRHLRDGRPLPFAYLSINLTAHSVSDTAFGDFLFDALERHAVTPDLLCFEITEGTALVNFEPARRLVARLRASGCRVMLDDFGSGFTSFDYLRKLPVDGLKIDQIYTQRLNEDRLNQTIVESICRISDTMCIDVVAEGVEDDTTLQAVSRLGVDLVQGHLYHASSPLGDILAERH